MFTVEQIKAAHSLVKSGEDFPGYIKTIKQLGVTAFETWVEDSHTLYMGANNYQTQSAPMYTALVIADVYNQPAFEAALKAHQQGKTGYVDFCKDCAVNGVEKWFVCLHAMTCSYYKRKGNEVLVEKIPA